ncbi:MAG: hypothetical protein HQL68_12845 [Magnetococcales bacterium]|nr:hypothetical protein [Magnetococcales bacterium]
MNSLPTEERANIYLRCIDYIATQLRGHAGQEPDAISRTIWKLRNELDTIHHQGVTLPNVANLDRAEHGNNNDLSTLLDVAEVTFDTILAYDGISRGRRYKSNEFATAMERSFKHRNNNLSLDYSHLKATLDIRCRQLGCLLSAAGTMLLTPLELRTLLQSLLTEDLLDGQAHIFAKIHERPKFIEQVLINLGLSSSALAQHFVASLPHTPTNETQQRCNRFQTLMDTLGMDSQECTHSWTRIKQHDFDGKVKPVLEFRDDGNGGWEEQMLANSPQNGWTTWLPLSPRKKTTHTKCS